VKKKIITTEIKTTEAGETQSGKRGAVKAPQKF